MTGWLVSTYPRGVKPSTADRLPSWKIHTSAPKEATIESVFMPSALAGRTTERRRSSSTTYVVTRMKIAVRGKSAAIRATTSSTSAAPPATRTENPPGGASGDAGARTSRTRARPCWAFGPYGVKTWTNVRAPRVEAARRAAAYRSGTVVGAAYRIWYCVTDRRGARATSERPGGG